jgi:hypothetical protein
MCGIVSDLQEFSNPEVAGTIHLRNSEMTTEPTAMLAPLCIKTAADLGPAVRSRRREQSLRIDDAASLSGVSVDLLSRLENGKGSVRLDKLLTVLDGLGLALVVGPKDHPWMQSVSRPRRSGDPEQS